MCGGVYVYDAMIIVDKTTRNMNMLFTRLILNYIVLLQNVIGKVYLQLCLQIVYFFGQTCANYISG